MDAKDELLRDFEQDVYESYSIWVSRACDGNGAEGAFKTIAARLAALGYRKVTTCSECEYWEKDEGPDEGHYCFNIGDVGSCEAGDYCSFGGRRTHDENPR